MKVTRTRNEKNYRIVPGYRIDTEDFKGGYFVEIKTWFFLWKSIRSYGTFKEAVKHVEFYCKD